MSRISFTSKDAVSVGPYSHAVESDGTIYLSGQTPVLAETGKLVEGSIADQTRQCFANLFAVLKSAGLGQEDVVNVSVYLTDMDDFGEMNAVYETMFSAPYPARTTIGVASLPLYANVEIGMVAKRGG